jgi:hypothetical protein
MIDDKRFRSRILVHSRASEDPRLTATPARKVKIRSLEKPQGCGTRIRPNDCVFVYSPLMGDHRRMQIRFLCVSVSNVRRIFAVVSIDRFLRRVGVELKGAVGAQLKARDYPPAGIVAFWIV